DRDLGEPSPHQEPGRVVAAHEARLVASARAHRQRRKSAPPVLLVDPHLHVVELLAFLDARALPDDHDRPTVAHPAPLLRRAAPPPSPSRRGASRPCPGSPPRPAPPACPPSHPASPRSTRPARLPAAPPAPAPTVVARPPAPRPAPARRLSWPSIATRSRPR